MGSRRCQAAPAPTGSTSPPHQPISPVGKSAPAWKSNSAGVPDASSAGTGLKPGMLAAVLLPPCAEGVPEAAAPQAARPGSFSPPAATGCCEGNAPESRRERPGPPPNPKESGAVRPQSNPRYSSPGQSWGSCPRLTGEVFPSIGRCRAGLGSQLRHSHPSLRRAKSGPRGRGRMCLASGLVRQCQRRARRETSPTCRPAPPPPVSQLLQAQHAKHLPLPPAAPAQR